MENKNKPKESKVINSINIVGITCKKINLELHLTLQIKEFAHEFKNKCRINLGKYWKNKHRRMFIVPDWVQLS